MACGPRFQWGLQVQRPENWLVQVALATTSTAAARRLHSLLRARGARPAGVTILDVSGRCCLRDESGRRLLGEGEPGCESDGAALAPHAACSDPYRLSGAAVSCIAVCMSDWGPQRGVGAGTARASSPAQC